MPEPHRCYILGYLKRVLCGFDCTKVSVSLCHIEQMARVGDGVQIFALHRNCCRQRFVRSAKHRARVRGLHRDLSRTKVDLVVVPIARHANRARFG